MQYLHEGKSSQADNVAARVLGMWLNQHLVFALVSAYGLPLEVKLTEVLFESLVFSAVHLARFDTMLLFMNAIWGS